MAVRLRYEQWRILAKNLKINSPDKARSCHPAFRGWRQLKTRLYKVPLLSLLFNRHWSGGGIDSLRSPCGQPTHVIRGLSNGQLPVVEPRSGILTPPLYLCNMRKKSPHLHASSSLKNGGEGGIDSLRSPLLGPSLGLAPSGPTQALFKNAPGVFVRAAHSCYSWSVQRAVARCRTPVGDSHPPCSCATCEKKARIYMRALL